MDEVREPMPGAVPEFGCQDHVSKPLSVICDIMIELGPVSLFTPTLGGTEKRKDEFQLLE